LINGVDFSLSGLGFEAAQIHSIPANALPNGYGDPWHAETEPKVGRRHKKLRQVNGLRVI
jgi:hypothetical protein